MVTDEATEYAWMARTEYRSAVEPSRQAVVEAVNPLDPIPHGTITEGLTTDESVSAAIAETSDEWEDKISRHTPTERGDDRDRDASE
jgi:hypothetical protein